MKLFELIDVDPQRLKPRQPPQFDRANDDVYVLGQGSFGSAYANKNDPGTVKKIVDRHTHTDLKFDPYFQYVTMLLRNNRMTSNPYFPKIYDVHPYKQGHDYHYTVDMERLHELGKLQPEEVVAIGNKLFFDYEHLARRPIFAISKEDRSKFRKRKRLETNKSDAEQLSRLVALLRLTFDRDDDSMDSVIRDPKFKQAVLLIKNLASKINAYIDIHQWNLMIRRGPGGAHLVITDPVA